MSDVLIEMTDVFRRHRDVLKRQMICWKVASLAASTISYPMPLLSKKPSLSSEAPSKKWIALLSIMAAARLRPLMSPIIVVELNRVPVGGRGG
jgi:hypothetical protein